MSWSTLIIKFHIVSFLLTIIILLQIDWLSISKGCILVVSFSTLHKTQASQKDL